jgi:hypothetical protein
MVQRGSVLRISGYRGLKCIIYIAVHVGLQQFTLQHSSTIRNAQEMETRPSAGTFVPDVPPPTDSSRLSELSSS